MPVQFQEIEGARIALWASDGGYVEGRKTLFFIHGSAGDHTSWKEQYGALDGSFNIVAVDLPGNGQSEGTSEQEVAAYARWVKKAVEALGLHRPVLIGHSLGAAIVLESALRYGDMLSGIVTVGGGAAMPVNPMVLDGMREDPSMLVNSIPAFAVSKKNRERLKGFLVEGLERVDTDVAYGNFLACNRFEISEEVERIRIPTLLICGEDDKMMPPKFSEYLEEKIPNARLVLIPETGHFVMMEDAQAFNEALVGFVDMLEG